MIKCQICATENLDNSQYCDECGGVLNKKSEGEKIPEFKKHSADLPAFHSAKVTTIGIPPIYEAPRVEEESFENDEQPSSNDGVHATLVIERGESLGTEFTLSAEESYIGRWDADNGVFPDVDLDSHDTEAKVSRRHARIVYNKGKYMIEDLGSTNGTFVNRGRRLIPGSSQLLNDGDEIIVGKTFLRFYKND